MTRIFQKLRRDFLTGLVVLIPIVLTVYLVWSIVSFIDKVVIPIIPPKYNPLDVFEIYIPGLGVFLFLIVTTFIGSLASGFLGRQMISLSEKILSRTPIISTIYNAIKQIIQAVFKPDGTNFKYPCLIEYPRKGVWAVGFATKENTGVIKEKVKEELINVFVPTTPNQTSGFLLMIPKKDLIYLDVTFEQASKFIVSAGTTNIN